MNVALGEICSYRSEKANASNIGSGDLYISTESMVPNKGGISAASSIPETGRVSLFRQGDTLVSNIRPYFKKIWHADQNGYCSNDILVFEPNDASTSDYLYWLLSGDKFFDYVMATSKGTKMPRGDKSAIMNYAVPSNDGTARRMIVSVMNPIQSKIEANTKLNGYLEELVEVDFSRRFDAIKSTIELGEVLSISTKSLKPHDYYGEIWEHYSIPAYDTNHRPVFELADNIKSSKYAIDANCILISKLNPNIKRIWMPACSSKQAVCSTEFIVYRPKNPAYRSFYYAAINAPAFTDFLLAHVTGSTGSRQRAQPKATLAYPMPAPGAKAIENFCIFADPIYEQIRANDRNSKQLEELRDALLPKLMSGEIDISKVDLTQLNSHLGDY